MEHQSNVDTSRPFRSVKEAVAIFGERILLPEVHNPKPFTVPEKETPDNLCDTVKKLEVELEDTKAELKLLKERETETEVAVALLNAELHKNMSKLALAEGEYSRSIREEDLRRGASRSLAQILNIGDDKKKESRNVHHHVAKKKKKPIVPLVGELLCGKKGTTSSHNALFTSSHLQWN